MKTINQTILITFYNPSVGLQKLACQQLILCFYKNDLSKPICTPIFNNNEFINYSDLMLYNTGMISFERLHIIRNPHHLKLKKW